MKDYILLFPGQGSQYVSMGSSFLNDDDKLSIKNILPINLLDLMQNGPIEILTQTEIAQPAILLHSITAFNYWRAKNKDAKIICSIGHSLGEYSALVAADVISLADGLKIVHARGTFMKEAVFNIEPAMAAILGIDKDIIFDAIKDLNDVQSESYAQVANINSPDQIVISGTKKGVEKAIQLLKEKGLKRAVMLPVSAPFHCKLMTAAREKLASYLQDFVFNDASFPIISNVTAKEETKAKAIKELLIEQVTSPVRFTDCVAASLKLTNEVNNYSFIEFGPKTVLSGLIKKIDRALIVSAVDTKEQADSLILD